MPQPESTRCRGTLIVATLRSLSQDQTALRRVTATWLPRCEGQVWLLACSENSDRQASERLAELGALIASE